MVLPQNTFDRACWEFEEKLRAYANHWKDYEGAAYSTRMEKCIKSIRAACDEMEAVLKEDAKPLRMLTPEEYEAKVAAGKKIKFAEGGEH